MRWLLLLLGMALPASAEGERAGRFDYWVLSLSWSAAYCALEGDARGDPQCDAANDYTFTLHGLWPQYEIGWPSFCPTPERDPPRAMTAGMRDVMGSAGLAWHQWKKHGRCSGLSAADYFALSRRALRLVALPDVFAQVRRPLRVAAPVVEDAFVEANPGLSRNAVTVVCDEGLIREVRICLSRDLAFRACGPDAARDCRMPDALLEPVR